MRGERSCELRLQLARPSASLPNSPPAHLLNSLSAHFPFFPAAHIGFLGDVEKFEFLELKGTCRILTKIDFGENLLLFA